MPINFFLPFEDWLFDSRIFLMFCTVSISKLNRGKRQVLLLNTDSLLIDWNVKVGILGRTGSGKSTLALSFFRFVEATEGNIVVDDVDISKIGLTDLRGRLTIIPRGCHSHQQCSWAWSKILSEDPTILSGTLRSTLDVFDEYEDAEIVRDGHTLLIMMIMIVLSSSKPSVVYTWSHLQMPWRKYRRKLTPIFFATLTPPSPKVAKTFRQGQLCLMRSSWKLNRVSPREKQLLCMARAILKRSKVLVMDEVCRALLT